MGKFYHCKDTQEQVALPCFPNCRPGYTSLGVPCLETNCRSGYRDYGLCDSDVMWPDTCSGLLGVPYPCCKRRGYSYVGVMCVKSRHLRQKFVLQETLPALLLPPSFFRLDKDYCSNKMKKIFSLKSLKTIFEQTNFIFRTRCKARSRCPCFGRREWLSVFLRWL